MGASKAGSSVHGRQGQISKIYVMVGCCIVVIIPILQPVNRVSITRNELIILRMTSPLILCTSVVCFQVLRHRSLLAYTQSLHKPCCRSGLLAAIAPKDGAPTVQVQDRTIGEFENHDTGVNLIL